MDFQTMLLIAIDKNYLTITSYITKRYKSYLKTQGENKLPRSFCLKRIVEKEDVFIPFLRWLRDRDLQTVRRRYWREYNKTVDQC